MIYFNSEHLPGRLLWAIVFATLFITIGKAVPDTYFRYFDKTQYLKITQPITMDKIVYKPCDTTTLTTQIEALVDVNVKSLTQLVLIHEGDGVEKTTIIIAGEMPIKAMGPHIISGELPLPCDLKDGRYFWQGNATYLVRGIEKVTSFITVGFDVNKTGQLVETKTIEKKVFVPVTKTITVMVTPPPTATPRPKGNK